MKESQASLFSCKHQEFLWPKKLRDANRRKETLTVAGPARPDARSAQQCVARKLKLSGWRQSVIPLGAQPKPNLCAQTNLFETLSRASLS